MRTWPKTKQALEKWLESDKSEEYRDATFAYSYFDLDYGSSPTWSEALYDSRVFAV